MEFFIDDPNIHRVPPNQTKFVNFEAHPDEDGKKIRIKFEITPFQQRPNIEINLTDSQGIQAASTSIIEPVGWKLELSLHIRQAGQSENKYQLSATIQYPEIGDVDHRTLNVIVPQPLK